MYDDHTAAFIADLVERALAGAPSGVIDDAAKKLSENPMDPLFLFVAGSACAAESRLQQAEALMACAVLGAPGVPLYRYQLGLLQHAEGRHAMALVTWAPLESGGDTDLLHYARGHSLLAAGDTQGAQSAFTRGLQLAQTNAGVRADVENVLSRILQETGTGEPVSEGAHVLLAAYTRMH